MNKSCTIDLKSRNRNELNLINEVKLHENLLTELLQEYYGQQALKLAGNTPVDDANRSYNVRDGRFKDKRTGPMIDPGNRNHQTGYVEPDRLIETNASMLGGDVGRPAGDYRYFTPDQVS